MGEKFRAKTFKIALPVSFDVFFSGPKFVKNLSKKFFKNFSKIFQKFVKKFSKICQKFVKNVSIEELEILPPK